MKFNESEFNESEFNESGFNESEFNKKLNGSFEAMCAWKTFSDTSVGPLPGLGELGYPLGQKVFQVHLVFEGIFSDVSGLIIWARWARVPTGAEKVCNSIRFS